MTLGACALLSLASPLVLSARSAAPTDPTLRSETPSNGLPGTGSRAHRPATPARATTDASVPVKPRSRLLASQSLSRSGAAGEPSCVSPRRKLWLDGEGWIVRRVRICR